MSSLGFICKSGMKALVTYFLRREFSTRLDLHRQVLLRNEAVRELVPISQVGYPVPGKENGDFDRILHYILKESEVTVPRFDVLLRNRVPLGKNPEYDSLLKKFGIRSRGSFDPWEKEKVVSRWASLVTLSGISDVKSCANSFIKVPWNNKDSYKKHVLGMFLGQGLNRHGNDVFRLWTLVIKAHKTRTFTTEEDSKILLRFQELSNGELSNYKIYSIIAKELNRCYPVSVHRRHTSLLAGSRMSTLFTVEIDTLILETLLERGESLETFQFLSERLKIPKDRIRMRYYHLLFSSSGERSKPRLSFEEQGELIRLILLNGFPGHEPDNAFFQEHQKTFKRNSKTLKDHWNKILLPVIRSHELGLLNVEWRHDCVQFLRSSLLRKTSLNYQARSPLELNYDEVQTVFKGQTIDSIKDFMLKLTYKISHGKEGYDLQKILDEASCLYQYEFRPFSVQLKNQKIVDLYLKTKKEILSTS